MLGDGRGQLFEVAEGAVSFLKLVPTGGVTLQTAASFLEAGAIALGVGADLVNVTAFDEGRPEVITQAARAYVEIIAKTRSAQAKGE